ncbi:hypothetical protein [Botrimarina sp.]|uniref:hypothetical protein n=1 Tax=Botrimarina sp. TaxID=2795802 RepID=UPI0032EC27FA
MHAENESFVPLLRTLIDAGDGVAEIVDHETGRVFVAVDKSEIEPLDAGGHGAPPACSLVGKSRDDRDAMIDAGYASGAAGTVDAAFWSDLRAKLAQRQSARGGESNRPV